MQHNASPTLFDCGLKMIFASVLLQWTSSWAFDYLAELGCCRFIKECIENICDLSYDYIIQLEISYPVDCAVAVEEKLRLCTLLRIAGAKGRTCTAIFWKYSDKNSVALRAVSRANALIVMVEKSKRRKESVVKKKAGDEKSLWAIEQWFMTVHTPRTDKVPKEKVQLGDLSCCIFILLSDQSSETR